jgi:hypothetical protein
MAKVCAFCNEPVSWGFTCFYCKRTYCDEHRIAENHECARVMAARHVEKDRLREKGVSITTGRFAAVCYQCGFKSEYSDILTADQERTDHMRNAGCPPDSVWLRRHEADLAADRGAIEEPRHLDIRHESVSEAKTEDWMYDCLASAKDAVRRYHVYCDCDPDSFFRITSYELHLQDDRQNAYAYINLNPGSRHFPIGVHPVLSERTPYNQKALVVVLVHELLHAIHPDWSHDRIDPQEKLLANKAGYFDALVELQRIAVNGKMRLCNN